MEGIPWTDRLIVASDVCFAAGETENDRDIFANRDRNPSAGHPASGGCPPMTMMAMTMASFVRSFVPSTHWVTHGAHGGTLQHHHGTIVARVVAPARTEEEGCFGLRSFSRTPVHAVCGSHASAGSREPPPAAGAMPWFVVSFRFVSFVGGRWLVRSGMRCDGARAEHRVAGCVREKAELVGDPPERETTPFPMKPVPCKERNGSDREIRSRTHDSNRGTRHDRMPHFDSTERLAGWFVDPRPTRRR